MSTPSWIFGKKDIAIPENYTDVVYIHREDPVYKEFGSIDHLVMTAVLLISLGLSLSRTIKYRGTPEVKPTVEVKRIESNADEKTVVSKTQIVYEIISAAGTTTSPFINTLCLFGLTGEIYKNDGSIIFFLVGVFLSLVILIFFNYFAIVAENDIKSFPAYLRKRFQNRGISIIVAISSILRHFVGGALNLCAMGIGVSAMTGLPALITSVIIASAAVFCTSMSRIHSGSNSSIGGILIWLVGITSLVTLTVTTINEGGLLELLSKAHNLGKLPFPKLSPAPWVKGSLWGILSIGILLGFQIFAFSRSTLRNAIAKDLSDKAFYGYICTTFILMSIWTFIGFWAGICVSVVFKGDDEALPDGLLAKLVTREMRNIKGFRGFFVSTLFAASISGLTRRYNQLVHLIWETSRDTCLSEAQRERTVSKLIKKNSNNLSEDYVKELTWEHRKRSCLSQFMFKLCMGITIGSLSCGIVFLFLGLGVTVWELWISILGIFIGPLIAAMLIGLFFPCISHMSVCLGLMVGWVIPCCLMIGNQNPNFDSYLSTQTRPTVPEKLENLYVPHPGSPLNLVDRPLKQTVFIYRCEDCKDEDQMNGEDSNEKVKKLSGKSRKYQYNILRTCYCYYAPIGMISCMFSSFLFAVISGKCKVTRVMHPASLDLLHPYVKKKYINISGVIGPAVGATGGTHSAPSSPAPARRKKINALKFLQETANI